MDPERTCVVCRTKRPKRELLRIVRGTSGAVSVDPRATAPGRGAWVCREPGHADGLAALSRALRAPLGPEDLARLRTEMEEALA